MQCISACIDRSAHVHADLHRQAGRLACGWVARLAAAPLAPHAPHLAGEPLAVAGPPDLEPLRSQRVGLQLGILLDLDLVRTARPRRPCRLVVVRAVASGAVGGGGRRSRGRRLRRRLLRLRLRLRLLRLRFLLILVRAVRRLDLLLLLGLVLPRPLRRRRRRLGRRCSPRRRRLSRRRRRPLLLRGWWLARQLQKPRHLRRARRVDGWGRGRWGWRWA